MGGTVEWLLSLTEMVEGWILSVADAWWVHLVVYAFAAFDGFFPTVPSESTIVTLSSLWSTSGTPSIILIGLAAWMGAWTGDNMGYWIGRKVGWERFRFLREGKGRKAVETADRGLQRRALLFLMTARYIPFGRTAVNLVAGAVRYPHHRFWPRSLLSTFVWAVYSCAIGAVAGAWFADHHLLAITVALIAALVLALIVERVISAVHRVLDRRADRRETERRAERRAVHAAAITETAKTTETTETVDDADDVRGADAEVATGGSDGREDGTPGRPAEPVSEAGRPAGTSDGTARDGDDETRPAVRQVAAATPAEEKTP